MSNIAQYLSDHTNAGACAANYYSNTHDPATCRVPAGVCSVIAYLVVELKNAEQRVAVSGGQPVYNPNPIPPLSPIPRTDGTGGSGQVGWGGDVETRRS